MNIKLAKTAGFCFGVDRAVSTVYESVRKYKLPIFTYGPIIHNDDVVSDLQKKGVRIINTIDEISQVDDGILIIRSHGVAPAVYDKIKECEVLSIDMTCPYVKKIHKIVKENHESDYQIIILGSAEHPEVVAINGWCEDKAVIVNSLEECAKLEHHDKVCIVAQTTFNHKLWDEIVNCISSNKCNSHVEYNTICNSTSERQREALELSQNSSAMIVIGSKNSSNTQKLNDICINNCKNCYFISNKYDLDLNVIKDFEDIGITAGASTPKSIINEVIDVLNNIDNIDIENFSKEKIESIEHSTNKKEEIAEIIEELIESDEIEEQKVENTAEVESIEDTKIPEAESEIKTDNSIPTQEDDFGKELEKSLRQLNVGDVIEGRVVGINDEEIIIDFGYKSDGYIPLDELNEDTDSFNVGDKISAVVINNRDESNIILSKRQVDIEKAWINAKSAFNNNIIVLIKIQNEVKGGVIGTFEGLRVFMPISQVSDKYIEDINIFIGDVLPAKIIEFDENTQNIVASAKAVIMENKQKNAESFWDGVFVGKEYNGTVTKIADYGAFIDIGGTAGLLHISEVTPNKDESIEKYLKVDDKVDVYIKEHNREQNKILLGYKNKPESPWVRINNRFLVGEIYEGIVTKLLPFGAFVQLAVGIEGLVHISQISDKRLFRPDEVLETGQKVMVKIVSIDKENKRMGLSIKEVASINDKGESNLDFKENTTPASQNDEDLNYTIFDSIKIKKVNK